MPHGAACALGLLADWACRGNALRLSALALGLAAAGSVVLLLLPLRGVALPPGRPAEAGILPEAIRYSPRLGVAAIPVAARGCRAVLYELAARLGDGRPGDRRERSSMTPPNRHCATL